MWELVVIGGIHAPDGAVARITAKEGAIPGSGRCGGIYAANTKGLAIDAAKESGFL